MNPTRLILALAAVLLCSGTPFADDADEAPPSDDAPETSAPPLSPSQKIAPVYHTGAVRNNHRAADAAAPSAPITDDGVEPPVSSGVTYGQGSSPAKIPVNHAAPNSSGVAAAYDEYPEFISHIKMKSYPNLAALEEHSGPHGILRVSPPVGYAVAFKTRPSLPDGEFRNGRCAVGYGTNLRTDGSCKGWLWISDKPGGPSLKNCNMGSWLMLTGMGFGVDFLEAGKGAPTGALGKDPCILALGKTYYCSFTATNGSNCDQTMASPLGDAQYQPDAPHEGPEG